MREWVYAKEGEMSSSWSCEQELRDLATELYAKASELEDAANVLATLREEGNIGSLKKRINDAKSWAKGWMERN